MAILDKALQKGTANEGEPLCCCKSNRCIEKLLRLEESQEQFGSPVKLSSQSLDFATAVALTRGKVHSKGQASSRQILKEKVLQSYRPGETTDSELAEDYSYDAGEASRGSQQWWWFTEEGSALQVIPRKLIIFYLPFPTDRS